MDENKWGLYGLIIGIIEFNLNLLLYIYLESIAILFWVILGSVAVIVLVVINEKFNQVDDNSDRIDELKEKLKRAEELNNLRLDIRELKRAVFKNE